MGQTGFSGPVLYVPGNHEYYGGHLGRLHREHASKADVRIVDFIDAGHPALLRMWSKRLAGYKAMGYRLADASSSMDLLVKG